jgi:aryl-alcohol dehydrogenase-like predicted oxidoreductase
MFNAVLLKGYFPAQWKVGQIILAPKPGKPPPPRANTLSANKAPSHHIQSYRKASLKRTQVQNIDIFWVLRSHTIDRHYLWVLKGKIWLHSYTETVITMCRWTLASQKNLIPGRKSTL